jgi:hypothetical protein
MPNWCNNRLQIKGTKEDLLAFVNDGMRIASTTQTSFDALPCNKYKEVTDLKEIDCFDKIPFPYLSAWLPMPTEMVADNKSNWYFWALGNWGSKWDVDICYYTYNESLKGENDFSIVLGYETAWSPNNEWVRNVGKKYPNLYFELDAYEPGCQIEFGCVCEDGNYFECEPDQDWIDDWKWDDDEEDVETDDSCLPQY